MAEAPGLAAKTRLLKEPERRGQTRRGPGGEPGCLLKTPERLGRTPHPIQKEAEKSRLMTSSKERLHRAGFPYPKMLTALLVRTGMGCPLRGVVLLLETVVLIAIRL